MKKFIKTKRLWFIVFAILIIATLLIYMVSENISINNDLNLTKENIIIPDISTSASDITSDIEENNIFPFEEIVEGEVVYWKDGVFTTLPGIILKRYRNINDVSDSNILDFANYFESKGLKWSPHLEADGGYNFIRGFENDHVVCIYSGNIADITTEIQTISIGCADIK